MSENDAARAELLQRLAAATASLQSAESALVKYAEVNMSVADELEREGHYHSLVGRITHVPQSFKGVADSQGEAKR
jgi:hypothetical protein